jgi:hypothetical protein
MHLANGSSCVVLFKKYCQLSGIIVVHAGRIMVLSIVLVFIPGIKHEEPIMDG